MRRMCLFPLPRQAPGERKPSPDDGPTQRHKSDNQGWVVSQRREKDEENLTGKNRLWAYNMWHIAPDSVEGVLADPPPLPPLQ